MTDAITPAATAPVDPLPAAAAEALHVTATLTDPDAPDAGAVLAVALERSLAARGMAVTIAGAARP